MALNIETLKNKGAVKTLSPSPSLQDVVRLICFNQFHGIRKVPCAFEPQDPDARYTEQLTGSQIQELCVRILSAPAQWTARYNDSYIALKQADGPTYEIQVAI